MNGLVVAIDICGTFKALSGTLVISRPVDVIGARRISAFNESYTDSRCQRVNRRASHRQSEDAPQLCPLPWMLRDKRWQEARSLGTIGDRQCRLRSVKQPGFAHDRTLDTAGGAQS